MRIGFFVDHQIGERVKCKSDWTKEGIIYSISFSGKIGYDDPDVRVTYELWDPIKKTYFFMYPENIESYYPPIIEPLEEHGKWKSMGKDLNKIYLLDKDWRSTDL
jgi:hypothetical protein